ncbi:hypothetical protein C8Q78DRAFT_1000412 [Trametes maxima]|nr:hypothetical protein C8Q78DRAFT_1000412 [Trametes maxima]
MSTGGPPWFAKFENGKDNWDAAPERLLRNPDLQRRGIVPYSPLKPGIVFRDFVRDGPGHVVKILDLSTEELPIYERLLSHLDCPTNHTLACEISRADHPLLIMPLMDDFSECIFSEPKTLRSHFRLFYELVEGIEYLHSLQIAHLDMAIGNVLVGPRSGDGLHGSTAHRRLYIIDFDTARQFSLGPGIQRAIQLPETQLEPPDGLTTFDPYSWDVHCLGRVFESFLSDCYRMRGGRPPSIAWWYSQWLVGKERGCLGTCRCRPTARTARQVLGLLCIIVPVLDLYERGLRWLFPTSA